MRFAKKVISALLIISCFCSVAFAEEYKMSDSYNYVDKMFSYATELYLDDTLDKDEIMKKAFSKYLEEHPEACDEVIKAGFSTIDDYTAFFTYEEYTNYVNRINHTFYGIGVVISKVDEYITISQVMENSSAEKAGIKVGDKIYKVDGNPMKDKSVDEVQNAVIGELGTEVNITVLRGNAEISFTMNRCAVDNTTVSSIEIDDNVGYMSVINFAENTADEFKKALNNFENDGIYNIILDLRGNPGGFMDSAIEIAQEIVPEGLIIQTMYRQSEKNMEYYSTLKNPKFQFAVLVDNNTASSAEILTSAIQDSKVGTVIGETTFGKGIIQEMFTLFSSNVFKITTGKYITRNGKIINKIGIEPDIYIVNQKEQVDVSKYPKITYSKESRIGDVCDNVSIIKERLQIMGYSIDSTDNTFDNDLEAAVLCFQKDKGLAKTGKLDRITMVQIENAFAVSEVTVDSQLYEAYGLFGGTREELDSFLKTNE